VPKVIGIIPSRYHSSRFPGKPLALIGGVPLVVRVMRSARQSRRLSDVLVATDDIRIAEAVKEYGGSAILSERQHATGSDRVAEAASRLDCEKVVNIQGDEPFITARVIDEVVEALDDSGVVMSSACSAMEDLSQANDPNVVKVVLDRNCDALYFSRSRIPHERSMEAPAPVYRHIGIYGFKREFLIKFASLKRTPLELSESLEQLRALEHGFKIRVIPVEFKFLGIDSAADLAKAEEILSQRNSSHGKQ